MSDSLILPASASVAPAVFAVRARSEPGRPRSVQCSFALSAQTGKQGRLTGEIDNGHDAARPRAVTALAPLLYLDAEEAVTARARGVAASAGHLALRQARLEHEQCLVHAAAHDLAQAGHHLAVGRAFGGLEEEGAPAHVLEREARV